MACVDSHASDAGLAYTRRDEGKESASGTCFESWAWSYISRSQSRRSNRWQEFYPL
jgi:hypothetical protein